MNLQKNNFGLFLFFLIILGCYTEACSSKSKHNKNTAPILKKIVPKLPKKAPQEVLDTLVSSTNTYPLLKSLYIRGLRLFQIKEYDDAETFLKKIEEKSQETNLFLCLSIITQGDIARAREDWDTAILHYNRFITSGCEPPILPQQEYNLLLDYSIFFYGYANWQKRPTKCCCKKLPIGGEVCLFYPSPEKRNLETVKSSMKIFDALRKRANTPFYKEKGHQYYLKALKLLSMHDLYVANYYWGKDKPFGSYLRLHRLLTKYPQTPFAKQVYLLLAKACYKLAKYVVHHPYEPGKLSAQEYIKEGLKNLNILISLINSKDKTIISKATNLKQKFFALNKKITNLKTKQINSHKGGSSDE